MSSLVAIEETVSTDGFTFATKDTATQPIVNGSINTDEDDYPGTPKSPSNIRIESVDEKYDEQQTPDADRQQTNSMVFKRANTVMLTDVMQWFEDDYVKLEPLGEPGTFGMAFKCYAKTEPNRFFAVKQINKAKFYFNETKGVLKNMKNEIDIMNNLSQHQHICKLHATREDRNYIYLILDFLSGGELYSKIEENEELDEKDAQSITKQILSAIQYMQQHNVAHLDLKPDNILFVNTSAQSAIKIIDFGEARIVSKTEKLNQKIGTPYYMAPEIIREIPYCAFPADMWSVGVITFCMLFGFVPFHAEEETEIFEKIKQGFKNEVYDGYGAFFPKDIPVSEDAMDIISGLLMSDPEQRFTIKDCLEHRWIRGQLTSRPSRSRLSTPSRAQKRHSTKNLLFIVYEEPITILENEEDDDSDSDTQYIDIEAPQNGIIKNGYLKKEGKHFKSWKRRWFILQNNGHVNYYHSDSDLGKPLGEFSVLSAQINKSKKIQHGIIIVTVQRNWKFAAMNDKHRNEWMRALEQASKHKENKQKKQTLHVNNIGFNKIRQTINESDHHTTTTELKSSRDSETTKKIEEQIDKQMLDMMNDLNLPQTARPPMYELDTMQKIQMIEQHLRQKLEKQSKEQTKDSNKQTNGGGKLHFRNALSDQFKFDPKLFGRNPPRPVSQSLATQSLAIKKKLKTAQNSVFGAKHDRCCVLLVSAAKNRIQSVTNDTDIMKFVEIMFAKTEEKKDIEEEDEDEDIDDDDDDDLTEIKKTKTRTVRSGVVTENAFNGIKAKYIHRKDSSVSFITWIECVEYMLKAEWNDEYTQRLYAKLVKSISLNQKAKIFSVGIERKTRKKNLLGKNIPDCFVGNEGIDWLIKAKFVKDNVDKRERAKDLGNSFHTKGFIKCVTNQHKFKDDHKLWYQFDDDIIDKHCLKETNFMN